MSKTQDGNFQPLKGSPSRKENTQQLREGAEVRTWSPAPLINVGITD